MKHSIEKKNDFLIVSEYNDREREKTKMKKNEMRERIMLINKFSPLLIIFQKNNNKVTKPKIMHSYILTHAFIIIVDLCFILFKTKNILIIICMLKHLENIYSEFIIFFF